jgi:hypothetical protein
MLRRLKAIQGVTVKAVRELATLPSPLLSWMT